MICFKNKSLFFGCVCLALFAAFSFGCKEKVTEPEIVRETGTVTDRQGNVYNTVKIGNQWWMAENLKVKVYNDSTPIMEVKPSDHDTVWADTNVGAFCSIDSRYGLHYNWFVISNSKKIAPVGWHVPGDEEWKTLEKELGMSKEEADKTSWRGNNESEKLIPESSVGWSSTGSTVYGTNESGFSALPGGCRLFNGTIGEVTGTAFWWSSTSARKGTSGWYRNVSSSHKTIFRYYADKNYGMTIRCVKD